MITAFHGLYFSSSAQELEKTDTYGIACGANCRN
jgi:hypothetical protein